MKPLAKAQADILSPKTPSTVLQVLQQSGSLLLRFRFLFAAILLTNLGWSQELKKPNILFIPIDDMNHWIGHLGVHPQSRTPNIDRLAKSGVSFYKAYCAAPACNPSRIALMSGMRPSTTGCYDNSQDWKPAVSQDKLLNATLSNAGYSVIGAGKVYHGGLGLPEIWDETFSKVGGSKLVRHPTAKDDGVGVRKFSPLSNSDEDMPDMDESCVCRRRDATVVVSRLPLA